jgi:SAM-dependent methyltransferase
MGTEPLDDFGESILAELKPAKHFSKWMFEVIEPFLGSKIIEVGSGIGNISRQLPVGDILTLSDYNQEYCEQLEVSFWAIENVGIVKLDLTKDDDFISLAGGYNSVVCLNVLEHINDDVGALERMVSLLEPGGRLIILVPQYSFLMSEMDRLLGHYRRYSHGELGSKLKSVGLDVECINNFNTLGIAGWFVNNTLLGSISFGEKKVRLFDATVPFMRPIEKIFPLPGLSVIGVGVNCR